MNSWHIIQGDCRERMKGMGPESVHCCVTSPPYFQQRDYGVDGQIGREEGPQEYVDVMVEVFRQVKRILRNDGTLWLNLGDKYIDKQLQGIPWRVALALQADGWILRSDIIWHKPDPMPMPVKDRPTPSHEYIFLFSKSEQYFYDYVAISEPSVSFGARRVTTEKGFASQAKGMGREPIGSAVVGSVVEIADRRNKRDVWTVSGSDEKERHFAVFPKRLIMPCILAGTSEKGCCSTCLAPVRRLVEKVRRATRPGINTKVEGFVEKEGNRDPERHVTEIRTIGWERGCDCGGETRACIVLDPFCGTATTIAAAVSRNRAAIGIELNPEYVEMGRRKMTKMALTKGFGL